MSATPPVDRRRRLAFAAGVGVLVAAVGVWAQNDALVGVNYDDAIYVHLSHALTEGDGYRLTYLPGDLPGVKYPPIYPLTLVPFWHLANTQDGALGAMKVANGIYIGIAAGLFTFLLAELGLVALPLAVVLGILGFVSGSMMLVAAGLLSEPTYLVLLFITLGLADGTSRASTNRRQALLGVLAGSVVLTRMVGLALLPAVIVSVWLRSGRRAAGLTALAAALLVGPWQLFTILRAHEIPDVLVHRYGSYLQLYLAGSAGSLARGLDIARINFGAILQTLGVKLAPGTPVVLQMLAGGALLVLAVLGSRIALRKAPATAIYPWLYLGIVCAWSFPPFRFVFLLFPFLLALAAVALVWVERRSVARLYGEGSLARYGRLLRYGMLALVAAYAAFFTYKEIRSVARRVWDPAELQASAANAELVDWVRHNTDPDAVIAHELDPLMALHSGRQAVPNFYESLHSWYGETPRYFPTVARLWREMRVDYVTVNRQTRALEVIDGIMGMFPGSLRLIWMGEVGGLVFEVNRGALEGEGR